MENILKLLKMIKNKPCIGSSSFTSYILIYSSIDRNLGCFHILTIVSNVAMKIGVHASFQNSVLFSLG